MYYYYLHILYLDFIGNYFKFVKFKYYLLILLFNNVNVLNHNL